MPTITLTQPVASTVITAGLHATNYNALQTLLNGGLDGANFRTDIAIGFGALGATFGGDVNLFRAAANTLATNDDLVVAEGTARRIEISQARLGEIAQMHFGAAADTNLYRDAANSLKTDDSFTVGINLGVNGVIYPAQYIHIMNATPAAAAILTNTAGTTYPQWQLGNTGIISWGGGSTSLDTNLYRSAANTLKSDDEFHSGYAIRAMVGTANEVVIGLTNVGTPSPQILFGNSYDTNLYRAAAGQLKTDSNFAVAGGLDIGADVNLSRTAANELSMASGDTFKLSAAGLKFSDNTTLTTAPTGGAYVRLAGTVDVANSTTEGFLISYQIGAGAMGTDKMLRCTVIGDMLQNAAGNLTLRIKFGGTTLWADTFPVTQTATRRPWEIQVKIGNLNAANSNFLKATVEIGNNGVPDTGLAQADAGTFGMGPVSASATSTIDTSAAQYLDITAQWSAASASLSFRKHYATIEIL